MEVGSYGLLEGDWEPRRKGFCRWCTWPCQERGPVVTFDFDVCAAGTLGLPWSSSAGKVRCDDEAQAVVLWYSCC